MRKTLVAFALVAVACSKPSAPDAAPKPATSGGATIEVPASDLADGAPAPQIAMTLQSGKTLRLAELAGKNVAVYFYPKDETPGCTLEAQQLRDSFDELKKADVTVIGVSSQDADSHKKFIEKEKLPFDLAIDADGSIAKAFGVPRILGYHARQTFLIGKDGRVKKAWRKVKPEGHAQEILDAAKG